MTKITENLNKRRETFIKKYGLQEYFFFSVGAIGILILLYWFATKQLEYNWKEGTALAVSFLFIYAPMTLLDIIRKLRGLDTKSNNL